VRLDWRVDPEKSHSDWTMLGLWQQLIFLIGNMVVHNLVWSVLVVATRLPITVSWLTSSRE